MRISDRVTRVSEKGVRIAPPYLIAEAGVNHEGSMETARRLISEAADGGADAIKFQTYRAHTIATKHSPAYWDTGKEPTTSQFNLFRKYDKFWEDEFEEPKKTEEQIEIIDELEPVKSSRSIFEDFSEKFPKHVYKKYLIRKKVSKSGHFISPLLKDIDRFKQAIILKEVLGKPRALKRSIR